VEDAEGYKIPHTLHDWEWEKRQTDPGKVTHGEKDTHLLILPIDLTKNNSIDKKRTSHQVRKIFSARIRTHAGQGFGKWEMISAIVKGTRKLSC